MIKEPTNKQLYTPELLAASRGQGEGLKAWCASVVASVPQFTAVQLDPTLWVAATSETTSPSTAIIAQYGTVVCLSGSAVPVVAATSDMALFAAGTLPSDVTFMSSVATVLRDAAPVLVPVLIGDNGDPYIPSGSFAAGERVTFNIWGA